jgi:hypothetical protein
MRQDIQTFSDITAINTQRKLTVDLSVTRYGQTDSFVKLNGFIINVDKITVELDLFDPVNLDVNLVEFAEGTSGLDVSLTVNGLEVLPKYQHLSSNKKCYIDTLEPWSYKIPSNFYVWYHNITGQGWIA